MTDWKKRAEEIMRDWGYSPGLNFNMPAAMLQLGQEMADARAEEVAQECDKLAIPHSATEFSDVWRGACGACAKVARSTITKPKTREQRLEEALREIVRDGKSPAIGGNFCNPYKIARKALEDS